MKATVFQKVTDPNNGSIESVEKLLQKIKTGGKIKNHLIALRDSETYKEDKMKLPVICFNGQFSKRHIDGLIEHNGLMVLDIDGLDDPLPRKQELKESPYVYAVFISPSYKGLKVLIKIPFVKTDSEFKEYFYAAEEEFGDIDRSGKDISRCCFFSYDPDIHINPDAELFTKRKKEVKQIAPQENFHPFGTTDYRILAIVTDQVKKASDGERHDALLKAARLAGGYIASGKLDQYEVERVLVQVFGERPYDRTYSPEKTVKDGIKYGLNYPIYDQPYNSMPKENKAVKSSENEFKDYGKFYIPFQDYTDKADELYKNGRSRGDESVFENARKNISFKTGFTTWVYSAPHSGKTQYCLSELVYQARHYNKKIVVYSKEIGDPADVFAEIASVYIGKLFIHEEPKLVMTKEEKENAKEFFKNHFYVIDPLSKGNDVSVTIADVLETTKHIEKVEGVKVDMIYIDPMSEIEDEAHLHGNRDDKFINAALTAVNNDAKVNKRHNILVTHVRDQRPITDKENNMSYYPVPTPRELTGGQKWYAKGYQMICIYRPPSFLIDPTTGEHYFKNETNVYIQKSKPKGIGETGMFKIYWQKQTNQFTLKPFQTHYTDLQPNPYKTEGKYDFLSLEPTGNDMDDYLEEDPF